MIDEGEITKVSREFYLEFIHSVPTLRFILIF